MNPEPVTPSASHLALVRAVTGPVADTIGAWETWRAGTLAAEFDHHATWLMPLLYVRLRAAGAASPALQPYENAYRHHWYRNHVVLRSASEGGVLVGGAAVAAAASPHVGARPFPAVTYHQGGAPLRTRIVHVGGRTVRIPDPLDGFVTACAGVGTAADPSPLLRLVDALLWWGGLDPVRRRAAGCRATELGLRAPFDRGVATLHAWRLMPATRCLA